jgi:ribosomal protein L4
LTLLTSLGAEGRVLVVVDGEDAIAWKSFRNLTQVHLLEAGQLNAFDILVADYVVFSSGTLPVTSDEGQFKRSKRAARAKAASEGAA